jgi:hypothetical protein
MNYTALVLGRISARKSIHGDSLDEQERKGIAVAMNAPYCHNRKAIKIFREIHTGTSTNRPIIDEVLHVVGKHHKTLTHVFVPKIDRFTRAGAGAYEHLKGKLESVGIALIDFDEGIIQPVRNHLQGIGGEWGEDLAYPWSVYSPSESAEVQRAQFAKEEARIIVRRLIEAEIKAVRKGYQVRDSSYGFQIERVFDKQSLRKRAVLVLFPDEARIYRKMYELAVLINKNIINVSEACEELNTMGFRTRTFHRWNKTKDQIIGQGGGNKMTPRLFWSMIEQVAPVAFKCEKWTGHKLVPAQHPPIVSVELWNEANDGRWQIVKSKISHTGWKLLNLRTKGARPYFKNHPAFPYKHLVRCSHSDCQKLLKGAYSKGQAGTKYPQYFCSRGHKTVSINPTKLKELLQACFQDMRFEKGLADLLEWTLRELWRTDIGTLNQSIIDSNNKVNTLRDEQRDILERIKILKNPDLIRSLEEDYDRLSNDIEVMEADRTVMEYKEDDIDTIVKYARHFVEHLDELVIEAEDHHNLKGFWDLIFLETPTLDDLKNRTFKLSPIIELKSRLEMEENVVVAFADAQSNSLIKELHRWAEVIQKHGLSSQLC